MFLATRIRWLPPTKMPNKVHKTNFQNLVMKYMFIKGLFVHLPGDNNLKMWPFDIVYFVLLFRSKAPYGGK